MLRRIRDWVFTVPLLVGFGLTLLVHDIAGRIALLFGLCPFERVMASLQRSLVGIYRVAGTRVNVERSPEIKPNTGYLIISPSSAGFCSPTTRSTSRNGNSANGSHRFR